MICSKCSNNLNLFANKYLRYNKRFKGMSLSEIQKLKVKPKRTVRKSPKPNQTRVEYNNGIACKEGMTYTGKRLKKGSFKKNPNNEGTRSSIGYSGLGEY